MNEEERSSYRPHFRRVEAEPFRIQPRDLETLRQVYKHRFLRSSHIAALDGGSEQHVRRRLKHLYHAGFLDRLRERIDWPGGEARKPYIYGLGKNGAELLQEELGIKLGRLDWAGKNREIGQRYLDHTLLTADVLVGFELACRRRGTVRMIDPGEILAHAPEATRRTRYPFRWRVPVIHEGTRYVLGAIPDGIFGLYFLEKPEGRNRAYFFLEADRATMPVERASLNRSSLFRKLLAYWETWKGKVHTERFGIQNFRVLTVTTTADRAAHIQAAALKASGGRGRNLFLTADVETIASADPLTASWSNAKGSLIGLTE